MFVAFFFFIRHAFVAFVLFIVLFVNSFFVFCYCFYFYILIDFG